MTSDRNLEGTPLENGDCGFHLVVTPCIKQYSLSRKSSHVCRSLWDQPCAVGHMSLMHSSLCTPNCANLVMVTKAAEVYVHSTPQQVLFILCRQYEMGAYLIFVIVPNRVCPIWPKNKNIPGMDIVNVWVKVMYSLLTCVLHISKLSIDSSEAMW